MLSILPVQTKEEQREICSACGAAFLPDDLCYAAREAGKLCALSQFRITKEGAVMHGVYLAPGSEADTEALILTGRAVFNFLEHVGVRDCYYEDERPDAGKIARDVGFRALPDGRYYVDLAAFFTHKH